MTLIKQPMGSPDANVREINNTHNIKSKTDFNVGQIETANKLNTLGLMYGNGLIGTHLTDLMKLQLSKDRKSRGELVEAIKSRITDLVNKAKTGLLG